MATRTAEPPVETAAERFPSAYGPARSTVQGNPSTPKTLRKIDAYWRACNYLALGMIYPAGQPAATRAAQAGAHQEPPARSLGRESRAGLYLYSPQPADQEVRPRA